MLTLAVPIIIGHPPTSGFIPFGAIRAPGFLPSAVGDFVLGTQWIYWLAALAAGALLVYVASRRGDKRLARAGVALVLLTVLWVGLSLLFDTPQERLRRAHESLLHAAETRDVSGVVALLAEDFQSAPLRIARPEERQASVERILRSYAIKSNRITSYAITYREKSATTIVTVLTDLESFGYTKTRWELRWADEPAAGWQLVTADLLAVNDVTIPNFTIPR